MSKNLLYLITLLILAGLAFWATKTGKNLQTTSKSETAFAFKDITPGIEVYLMYQNKKLFSSEAFPFIAVDEGFDYGTFHQQSASLTGRFSFNERFVEGHFQRFYQKNNNPVIYSTFIYAKKELLNSSSS